MSLREAATLHVKNTGSRAAIDVLLETLGDAERADVLDLLKGEPLLPHSVVARTLQAAYGDRFTKPLAGERVRSWRNVNGVA